MVLLGDADAKVSVTQSNLANEVNDHKSKLDKGGSD